jgi:hypothetical protein
MPADRSNHDAWRAAFHAAVNRGHSPAMAAVIASRAFPDIHESNLPLGDVDLLRCVRYGVVGFIILFVGMVGATL